METKITMSKILIALISLGLLLSFGSVWAKSTSSPAVEINFFYSRTCPHCAAESDFLSSMEQEYSRVEVNRYVFSENVELARDFFEKHDIDKKKFGLVPATFINGRFFLGFASPETTGAEMEKAIRERVEIIETGTSTEPTSTKPTSTNATSSSIVNLPLIGKLDTSQYSLPLLTVIMGTLDGFNICSLGALVLILGLVLTLRSRAKIFAYGGIFLLTTAIVYGILIVLWYKLFDLLSDYMRAMEILIGLLGIGGGIYFLKEFLKFRRYGPTCETGSQGITNRFTEKIKKTITEDSTTTLALIGLVLLFAAIITVVEFPCSAAVPLVYAGILAKADLSSFSYLIYIAFFVLFYLADELIVFGVAVWKMSVWMTSPKFVTWITLVESIILFGLGIYYLFGLV